MKNLFIKLQDSFQEELGGCKQKKTCLIEEIECCHQAADRCLKKLRSVSTGYKFEKIEDEILYFKTYKPFFISETIFYELLYHAELFKSIKSEEFQILLLRQKKKLSKLIRSNPDFYSYYKSGDSSKDKIYFVRKDSSSSSLTTDRGKNSITKRMTGYAYLVAKFIALERFDRYIEQKLQESDHQNA